MNEKIDSYVVSQDLLNYSSDREYCRSLKQMINAEILKRKKLKVQNFLAILSEDQLFRLLRILSYPSQEICSEVVRTNKESFRSDMSLLEGVFGLK